MLALRPCPSGKVAHIGWRTQPPPSPAHTAQASRSALRVEAKVAAKGAAAKAKTSNAPYVCVDVSAFLWPPLAVGEEAAGPHARHRVRAGVVLALQCITAGVCASWGGGAAGDPPDGVELRSHERERQARRVTHIRPASPHRRMMRAWR